MAESFTAGVSPGAAPCPPDFAAFWRYELAEHAPPAGAHVLLRGPGISKDFPVMDQNDVRPQPTAFRDDGMGSRIQDQATEDLN